MKNEIQKYLLKDIAAIIAGQSPESKYYNTNGEGIPFFQGKADFGALYPNIRTYCSQPIRISEKDAFYDENEFRIVLRDHILPRNPGLYQIDYRIKDGVFIPYTKLEFNTGAIKSIGISPSEKQRMAKFSVERMLGPKYHLNYGGFFCSKIPYSP